MADAGTLLGLVTCACGVTLRFHEPAATPSPLHFKTWCHACGATLEGEVALTANTEAGQAGAAEPAEKVRYVPISQIRSRAELRELAARALAKPGPHSLDELEAAFNRLAAPFLAPGGADLPAEERLAVRELLLGLLFEVATYPGVDSEADRAQALRANQEAVMKFIRAQGEHGHVP